MVAGNAARLYELTVESKEHDYLVGGYSDDKVHHLRDAQSRDDA